MLSESVKSGFRTQQIGVGGGRNPSEFGPVTGFASAAGEATGERWGFEALVRAADAVFLVLEEEGRKSRWLPMVDESHGRWGLTVLLRAGRLQAKIYAQSGTTLVHCGGSDLFIYPPVEGSGGVQVSGSWTPWFA